MLSRFIATTTVLSLGILASAQTWPGDTYAIQGEIDGQFSWVQCIGSPFEVAINYIPKPTFNTTFFKWVIKSADNAIDPSTQVTFFNSFGGFAEPYGGHPLVCGGQGMLLRTAFTAFPTVWNLHPLGNDRYKISTNITTPNSGGKQSQVFWSIHLNTGLLPLDPEDKTTCTDSGGIAQVFHFLPPSALT